MLDQRDILRRFSGRPDVFMPGPLEETVSAPVRTLRTIQTLPDGTRVQLAYDETLELQAIVTSGATPVEVKVTSHAAPETTHTHAMGSGNRETALPSSTASKVRVRRVAQHCPRWNDIAFSIRTG